MKKIRKVHIICLATAFFALCLYYVFQCRYKTTCTANIMIPGLFSDLNGTQQITLHTYLKYFDDHGASKYFGLHCNGFKIQKNTPGFHYPGEIISKAKHSFIIYNPANSPPSLLTNKNLFIC